MEGALGILLVVCTCGIAAAPNLTRREGTPASCPCAPWFNSRGMAGVQAAGAFGGIMKASARVTAWLTLRRKDKNPPRLGIDE
jgi:hypothetical protein